MGNGRRKEKEVRGGAGRGSEIVSSFDGYVVWHDREKGRRRKIFSYSTIR